MSNNLVATALYQLLADSFSALHQVQNIHWNIEGENFYSIHKLTEAIYTEQFEAIDELAERLRALGEKVDVQSLAKTSKIKIGDSVDDLLSSQIALSKSAEELIQSAAIGEDKVTEDLAITRKQTHDKNIWMLKSQLK